MEKVSPPQARHTVCNDANHCVCAHMRRQAFVVQTFSHTCGLDRCASAVLRAEREGPRAVAAVSCWLHGNAPVSGHWQVTSLLFFLLSYIFDPRAGPNATHYHSLASG